MKQGDKAYKDGIQVALFPLDILWCTQIPEADAYSHCCGTATDWIGTTAIYPYYAPFDCHRIYLSSGNAAYRSDYEVLTPSGKKYLTVCFLHDDNIPSKTEYKQGEIIGHTGTTGYVTGDHVHIDQSTNAAYLFEPSGRICGSGRECYQMVGGINITDAFFITGEEREINTLGLKFKKIEDYQKGNLPIWIMGAAKLRREQRESGRHRKIL